MADITAFLRAERLRIAEAVLTVLEDYSNRNVLASSMARDAAWDAGRSELERVIHRVMRRVSARQPTIKDWDAVGNQLKAFVDEQLTEGIRSSLTPGHRDEEFSSELQRIWAEELKADVEFAVTGHKASICSARLDRYWTAGIALVSAAIGWGLGRL